MFVFSKGKPKTTNILLTDRRNNTNDRRTCRYRKKFNREKDGEFRERENYLEYFKDEVPRENIWEYTVGLYNSTSDKIAFKHPAIFPEQLASDHIKSWTNKNDIVLDPFMGSGTVGKMCSILHRNFIGIELVEEYYKIAKERIDETIKVNSRKLKVKSIFGKL
jgi:site-specific DNA-methyltransferase (adenine-specific)